MNLRHTPVMLNESMDALRVGEKTGVWVDATLGFGGHSMEILKNMKKGSRLIAFEKDSESLNMVSEKFSGKKNFLAVHCDFSEIKRELEKLGIKKICGILYDLGVSGLHFDAAERGFSFSKEAPLDMRLDRSAGITARDVVNNYTREELERVLKEYGEERHYRKIAGRIIRSRPVETTVQLAKAAGAGPAGAGKKIHPATKMFQAIRIEVNGELESLKKSLENAVELLEKSARIVVISFHSLEDRIVKRFFNTESSACICENKKLPCRCGHSASLKIITKKPLVPSKEETAENARSRSAKLRAAEKIQGEE